MTDGTIICVVCGGSHSPSSTLCDQHMMDKQISKMGARKWNTLTAFIMKEMNPASAHGEKVDD